MKKQKKRRECKGTSKEASEQKAKAWVDSKQGTIKVFSEKSHQLMTPVQRNQKPIPAWETAIEYEKL